MNTRVTLQDVAREAGVSPATVDRVINNREGVRQRTREVVLGAAQRLGYLAESEPALPRPLAPVQVTILLPEGTNTFIRMLAEQLRTQAQSREALVARVLLIEAFDPPTLAERIAALRGRTDAVGLVALDHPLVREAIRGLEASGIPVVTIATDILNVPRVAYVGVDNRQAGRLAGYLLGRFLGRGCGGKVALFAGSLAYRGHEEREAGFRHALREMFPNLEIVEMLEVHDDRETARVETAAVLERHPDLAAIYNSGAGITGIAAALREAGRAMDVVLIGHEATEANRAFVLDGTIDAVIDQNPRVEARETLNALAAAARGEAYQVIQPRIQVAFCENFPDE